MEKNNTSLPGRQMFGRLLLDEWVWIGPESLHGDLRNDVEGRPWVGRLDLVMSIGACVEDDDDDDAVFKCAHVVFCGITQKVRCTLLLVDMGGDCLDLERCSGLFGRVLLWMLVFMILADTHYIHMHTRMFEQESAIYSTNRCWKHWWIDVGFCWNTDEYCMGLIEVWVWHPDTQICTSYPQA